MEQQAGSTYLTARELAQRIKYKPNVINNMLKDSVLLEGVHYVRPFGRRKVLYLWEAVERTMLEGGARSAAVMAMGQ
ncbi:hypothetical protein HZ992_12325 [Rhizobacter sp. AJA081-3]|jgi:hypothetical protein|uniref:hypothetical protein n=1 Tax=Rhizobacter sp. AJA081-3 TaxID=2753607 RepID=UPI001ADF5910|nr:hypothetical protein [Rhizobacter sp. AJA081-3]QTN25685.1 hypothetical protein HZ992_12325 [Rhizobacter sp. AJA081-3]